MNEFAGTVKNETAKLFKTKQIFKRGEIITPARETLLEGINGDLLNMS